MAHLDALAQVETLTGDLHVHGPLSAYHHMSKSPPVANIHPAVGSSLAASSLHALSFDTFGQHRPKEVYLTARQHSLVLDRFFAFHAAWCESRFLLQGHCKGFADDSHGFSQVNV
jgi:hypothetical protein